MGLCLVRERKPPLQIGCDLLGPLPEEKAGVEIDKGNSGIDLSSNLNSDSAVQLWVDPLSSLLSLPTCEIGTSQRPLPPRCKD